jgi:hypothetical protein
MAAEWLETAPDLGTRRARNHETNSNHCPAVGGDCCLCRTYRRHCALVHLAITKVCENSNIKSESMRLQYERRAFLWNLKKYGGQNAVVTF